MSDGRALPAATEFGGSRLAENLLGFGRALRAAGLPVGPGTVLSGLAAVEAVGLARRDDLRWTLHAVFVSRHDESAVFDAVFARFWRRRGFRKALSGAAGPAAPAEPPAGREREPAPGETRARDALGPRPPDTAREPGPDIAVRLAASDRDTLRRRDFAQMSADEIARARRLIDAMAMPDDARRTRRLSAARRGRVDLRASLRAARRMGGATIPLAFRAPTVRPRPIVALLDVSGSMAEYSRVFLHFLQALASRGRRVHAFVFATRLTNVSRELAGRDPDEALARAAARVSDWEGGTRIASALHVFNRDWSRRVLGGGATVLLFTDGLERDPRHDLAFETDRLRRSCARLVWLNPLLRFPAFAPRAAGIRAMLPHVDALRPIHDLASMEGLVAALAAPGPRRLAPPSARPA